MYHSIYFTTPGSLIWSHGKLQGTNTWGDFHLIPSKRPTFAPPEPNLYVVDIPGGAGIDLTDAITGYPSYKRRTGELEFLVADYDSQISDEIWQTRYREMQNFFNFSQLNAVLEDDPGYYYTGWFVLNKWSPKKDWSRVTLNYSINPYKKSLNNTLDDWLWDPFNFETDMVRHYASITVSGTTPVTVYSSPIGGSPTFIASAAMTMTYEGITYNLSAGNNIFPTIELPHDNVPVTFTFNGSGTVSISFRPGSL